MEIIRTTGYQTPVHALTETKFAQIVQRGLMPRLFEILSIDLADRQERLIATEKMIRESANRITPEEIEKAFMKYAKGELPGLEPRDNYLTPILFSKVINAYKQIKPQSKPEPIEIDEDLEIAKQNVMLAFYDWQETGQVSECYAGVFDRFLEWGILPKKGENEKADKRYDYLRDAAAVKIRWNLESQISKEKAKPGASTPKLFELKQRLSELLAARYNDTEIQNTFRCAVLEGFFKKTTEEELKEKLL